MRWSNVKNYVLIACPSLDVKTNVSGISALVGPLVVNYPERFIHLCVGTPDASKSVINRIYFLLNAFWGLIKFALSSGVKRFHLNTAADTPSLVRDILLFILARILFIPVVVHFHGGKWITTPDCPRFARFLVWALATWGRACVVLGQAEAYILKNKFHVSRPISILPNYVSPEYICDPQCSTKEPLTVLFLGRLVESKSVDKLAYLFGLVLERVPNSRLIICGDGPLRENLLNDLQKLPANSWVYKGVVSGKAKLDVLRSADVYILPSVTGEGMPIAMLEAMACGAIPVVTRLGAIASVIESGVNGYLVEPGDFMGFVNSVIDALSSVEREILRVNAYKTSFSYSISTYKIQLEEIYCFGSTGI